MKPMIYYEPGDVILVKFPFTTLVQKKQRPAVVVSTGAYNQAGADVIATAITGNLKAARRPGDFSLTHWHEAGLLKKSLVKFTLFTLEKSLIICKLGKLKEPDLGKLSMGLKEVLGLA